MISYIDEYRSDGTGWARFSLCKTKRYRLGRIIDPKLVDMSMSPAELWKQLTGRRVIFLMLNPSTADAFKLDQTVSKCMRFAQRWGAQIVEVVNLFAYRTSLPPELFRAHYEGKDIGQCEWNNAQIIEACTQPDIVKVIAAWGNHGAFRDRDQHVCKMLAEAGVQLWSLGITQASSVGYPMHPLARGKNFIPLEREPKPYSRETA